MRKSGIALPLLLAATLAGCGLGGPAYRPASGAAATVDLADNLTFTPATLRIEAGQTVEWRNRSNYTHTVTDDPSKVRAHGDALLPTGALPFGGELRPGQVYRHTFSVPGIYRYVCLPHESWEMRGEVIVAPAP
jgi:plastocyanin